jgi:hypothetical protein
MPDRTLNWMRALMHAAPLCNIWQDPSSYPGTPHCHSHKSTLHAHIQKPLKLINSNNVVPLADVGPTLIQVHADT